MCVWLHNTWLSHWAAPSMSSEQRMVRRTGSPDVFLLPCSVQTVSLRSVSTSVYVLVQAKQLNSFWWQREPSPTPPLLRIISIAYHWGICDFAESTFTLCFIALTFVWKVAKSWGGETLLRALLRCLGGGGRWLYLCFLPTHFYFERMCI